ncbi:SMK killer toxin resistance protein [Onygenales sp. PD_40]|nr:SMK killer toxin resistance protein [Onygenales sp. PD_40]KAK2778079.1 SMK killer toxin resistance protein [Onygenales sp. PD_12]
MASFIEDLWSSIFTPGATPTLLLATNATFAALQLLLFALLLATYSIHFIVLSFLCASLWWAINWFAKEVEMARTNSDPPETSRSTPARPPGAIDTESETETESLVGGDNKLPTPSIPSGSMRPPPPRVPGASTLGARAPPSSDADDLRKRRNQPDSSGYVSTDSEWEKVDEKER